MAKYLLLIYGDQQAWAEMEPEERQRIEAGHRRFSAAAGAAVYGGHELAPPGTATSLRGPRNGDRPEITDAPFVESKEVIGGFYLIDVADLDEAIRLAALLPETAATYESGVEIRPVIEAV
jgi:hypothetical protein